MQFKSLPKVFLSLVIIFVLTTLVLSPEVSHAQTALGNSLAFDGVDDVVRISNIPLLNSYTVEFWVKRTGDQGYYETILADTNRDYTQGMLSVFIDGDDVDCGVSPSEQFAFYFHSNFSTQCSGVQAGINQWHHIAVTRNSQGRSRIYVDGVVKNTLSNSPNPVDSSGTLTLGRAGDHPYEYFQGLIDELRISNTEIYTNDFTPPTSPLTASASTVLLYHFDEGTGLQVIDSSTNARNGSFGDSQIGSSSYPSWSPDNPTAPTPTTPPSYSEGGYSGGYSEGSYSSGGYSQGSYSTGSNQPDINSSGKVDIFDLSILLRNWGKSGQGDLNNSGLIDIFDLSILLRSWTR